MPWHRREPPATPVSRLLVTWVCAVTVVAADCGLATPADATPRLAEIEAAIDRGLSWIEQNPATPQDGGLGDIIDEAVSFSVLAGLQNRPADRARFRRALRTRLARLETLPDFQEAVQWPYNALFADYHLLLAAYLLRQAGRPSALEPTIVEGARRTLDAAADAPPTVRLTVAVLLGRLGEPVALDALLEQSLLQRIAEGNPPKLPSSSRWQPDEQRRVVEIYGVVHEVVALTDFGRLPPTPWLAARRGAVVAFLTEAASGARAVGNVDLVAELVLGAHFLGAPLDAPLRSALDWLAATQLPDGSWGDAVTNRTNKRRHAVLTAVAALQAYANTLAAGGPEQRQGEPPQAGQALGAGLESQPSATLDAR